MALHVVLRRDALGLRDDEAGDALGRQERRLGGSRRARQQRVSKEAASLLHTH